MKVTPVQQTPSLRTSPSLVVVTSSSPFERMAAYVTRWFVVRRPTITKGFLVLLILSVASLIFLSYYVTSFNSPLHVPPHPTLQCRIRDADYTNSVNNHISPAQQLRIDNKVLILAETLYTAFGQDLVVILEANRISYKMALAGKSLPSLTHADKGKFGVVIFERLESYLNMDNWNRQLLDKYCRDYNVGIIAFAHPDEALYNAQVRDFPLFVHTKLSLRNYEVNPSSPVLRVTRASEVAHGILPSDEWTVFVGNHSTYEPLAWAKMSTNSDTEIHVTGDMMEEIRYIPVMHDRGIFDGIQRMLFGNGLNFWLHKLLFLDTLSYLSHGKLSISLDRYILIDVDDIFVSRPGTRMKRDDVEAMLAAQLRIRKIVKDFKFNLGFSGKYFRHGTEEENEGDDALIENRHAFWWFGHSWSHTQAHTVANISSMIDDMRLNQGFAKLYDIPVNQSYAVAPHHSGVYPVHEELYEAWKNIWHVKVTSTEEYPHLRPARHRRGFTYRDIMVLPRQTCGLFTHTIFINKFPGGREKLDLSIRGGDLFQIILYNQISIFMTHLSNYGNDRLGLYTFESVVKFLQCWTNLRLQTVTPMKLANIYFSLYPNEKTPIWRNPCDDHRHLEIWSDLKSCERLPHFLVVGPQKTGTTALYTFLSMHPSVASNFESPNTFEEVQFFNGKNYFRGLDWYMEHFPLPDNGTRHIVFEKSANYFDSEEVPERAFALLPRAKLICILIHPARRAYSWYQHMRAHEDPVALEHSFYEVVSADESARHSLKEIKHRCLNPGLYAQHLERWLSYYDQSQLMIIDGEMLRSNPIEIMNAVQSFLEVDQFLDYSKLIKFDKKKGFFCQIVENDKTKCLGRGKGRRYPPMDTRSEALLKSFYHKPNVALSKLLGRLGQPVPDWLTEELSNWR